MHIPPATPTVTSIAPVPNPFPLGVTPRPLVPGINNPYYAGGATVPILSYSSQHGLDGNYEFSFSTADGKQAQESGYLKDAFVDPQGTQVVQGSYAYVSPDGTPIQVSYVADENGFRPSGVHIPANGNAVFSTLDKNNKQIYDPAYNRYNPILNRNRFLGPYNNGQAYDSRFSYPLDPRYPYNPSRFNPAFNYYNQYKFGPIPAPTPIAAKNVAKKNLPKINDLLR